MTHRKHLSLTMLNNFVSNLGYFYVPKQLHYMDLSKISNLLYLSKKHHNTMPITQYSMNHEDLQEIELLKKKIVYQKGKL